MSDRGPIALRRELLIDQGIDQQLNALVKQANRTAYLLKGSRMEESQLRNLLNAAIESRSIEVVVSFIRYQIARPNSAWGTAPNSFGHTVIKELREQVKRWTDETAKFVAAQSDAPALTTDDRAKISIRLMQLYLGYLNRAFYYGKRTNEFDTLLEVADA